MKYELRQLSEFSFLVRVSGDNLLESISQTWIALKKESNFENCIIIPSYETIYIEIPFTTTYHPSVFEKTLLQFLTKMKIVSLRDSVDNIIEIPIYYDPEVGKDLPFIALKKKVKIEDIVQIHSEKTYDVYSIGFLPGFAYLGKIDPRLNLSRKENIDGEVKSGTLAIAEDQTAIYSLNSPGGWHQIGKTPIDIIDEDGELSYPLKIGRKVKFNPISRDEFIRLGGEI
ncbi:MAG: carboxyltransferase domain-containing protein [Bacteriovoracaceae bacterium]|nr:carboxyltransferase domain-containing protein [Bacteriovoracaceae bacterium]